MNPGFFLKGVIFTSTVMWVFYAYLFLPVLNIILWGLGIRYFYVEIFEKVGYMELLDLFNKMGWTILIVFGTLRMWGYYNYRRFGKRNRRKAMPYNNIEQLSRHFQVSREKIIELQSKKEAIWPIKPNPIQDVEGNPK